MTKLPMLQVVLVIICNREFSTAHVSSLGCKLHRVDSVIDEINFNPKFSKFPATLIEEKAMRTSSPCANLPVESLALENVHFHVLLCLNVM